MNIFCNTISKNRTNKIVDELYKNNQSYDDHQVKDLFKKIFHKQTNANIKHNSKKEECLICYDKKKKKYKGKKKYIKRYRLLFNNWKFIKWEIRK